MKTNQPGKQNILLLYVDKIVFGVLVLVSLYYIYSATGLASISWTPVQLTEISNSGQKNIDDSTYRKDLKITEYDVRARDIRSGFKHIYYITPEKWEQAVFPEKIKRGTPKIHSVINLRARSDVGAIRIKEDESMFSNNATTSMGSMGTEMGVFGDVSGMGGTQTGGGKLEAEHWVLLTGLIPYEVQLREYVDKFSNAMQSSAKDFPDYLFVEVERNEIGMKNPDGTLVWKPLQVVEEYAMHQLKWVGTSPEPVDLQYILPARVIPTSSPLPPLANRVFGQEVAYPPYIPLMSESLKTQWVEQQKVINEMMRNWRPINFEDLQDILKGDSFSMTSTSMGGGSESGFGGGYGGMTGGATGGANAITGMYNPGGGAGGMGGIGGMGGDFGGMGGVGRMGGVGGMSGVGGNSGAGGIGGVGDMGGVGGMGGGDLWRVYTKKSPTVMVEAKYRLFRYFDFTVEPDKSYQYRVRLAVLNPNFRMNDQFLEDETITTKLTPYIYSDFSYPSGPAAVNSNARVLAKSVGNIPPANRAWQPQTVTVSSIVFDSSDNEDYIVKDKTSITQGTVLNFPKQISQKVSELTSTSSAMSDMTTTGMSPSSAGGRGTQTVARTTSKTLDHISGMCVLDVVGKRKLIGSNNEHTPHGQVLVMAFDGTIEIQSVKSNKLELDRYEKPATTAMSGALEMP